MRITRNNWRARMTGDLRLADKAEATRRSYLLSTRQLFDWLEGEPELWDEDDVRRCLLFRQPRVSPSTFNVNLNGIRFFLRTTLRRDWPLLDYVTAKRPWRLPVVLSRREVRSLIGVVRDPQKRTMLVTIYGLGLRHSEALALRSDDIDSDRRMVWIRNGKGRRDRFVTLPRHCSAGCGTTGRSTARRSNPIASSSRRRPAARRTGPRCRRPSSPRAGRSASTSRPPFTASAIATQRICSRAASACRRSRSCWGTERCARRGCTCT